MLVRIEGTDLPGLVMVRPGEDYRKIHVGVQRGREAVELFAGDSPSAEWSFEVTVKEVEGGFDFRGPHVQGKRGDRFVYLTWGTVDETHGFTMFRRAKLHFVDIEESVLAVAAAGEGTLVGRLGLTDAHCCPLCARVRPPVVNWSCDQGPTG